MKVGHVGNGEWQSITRRRNDTDGPQYRIIKLAEADASLVVYDPVTDAAQVVAQFLSEGAAIDFANEFFGGTIPFRVDIAPRP